LPPSLKKSHHYCNKIAETNSISADAVSGNYDLHSIHGVSHLSETLTISYQAIPFNRKLRIHWLRYSNPQVMSGFLKQEVRRTKKTC
jgi:peptide/nickel transport system substrate-binding protein